MPPMMVRVDAFLPIYFIEFHMSVLSLMNR